MNTIEIEKRYNELAQDNCCLSCGGAINYSKVQKGDICVDLGCGRGSDVMKMAMEVGTSGYVYGIDISEGMLEKARKTADKLKVKHVSFIRSALESLPLKNNSVDIVISNCTINHSFDKQAVWNEIYRILKAGGRFVVSDIYALEIVPAKYRNDPVAVAECWAGAIQRDDYMNVLQKAGFKTIEILEESTPYQKGEIEVASFTIASQKVNTCCCS